MSEESRDIHKFRFQNDSISDLHNFSHEAMATTFEISIQSEDRDYANKAAIAGFDELDKLEQQLSRYIENSDISRVNNLTQGRTTRIGLSAFDCLSTAKDIHNQTSGAFDVTIGSLYDCWIDENKEIKKPIDEAISIAKRYTGTNLLELDETDFSVKLVSEKVCLDLGGIGKGYAVDQIAQLLYDWSIDKALIHGGYSTIVALNPPDGRKGWPVTISNPQQPSEILARFDLANCALGISGLQKGRHIIDPRTARPVHATLAAWALAERAAEADALSTAFMVMNHQEIEKFCQDNPTVLSAIIREHSLEKIYYFGRWDQMGLDKK